MAGFIKRNYSNIISLGSNCFFKMYISHLKISKETNYFDYIGSSMWAIVDLIKNDELDKVFDKKEDFENMRIMSKGDDKYIITNRKYYLRFKHNFKQDYQNFTNTSLEDDKLFNNVKESYNRRSERLINQFNNFDSNSKPILFLRYEEENDDRIIHEEYKDKNKKSEFNYLIEFSNLLKIKYKNLKFHILFFTTNQKENLFLKDENIILINIKNKNLIKWDTCCKDFDKIFRDNDVFIKKCIVF